MCGICGKLSFTGTDPDEELVRQMCSMMIHRGPDAERIHLAGPMAMGQRRLSVIDLREAATPPLCNEDKTIWVVFNGEIYNYQTLRDELMNRGHLLCTRSDTEVILHLYEDYGVECLKYLSGMFAFAIWDSKTKILFAARDRFGEKPLYFCRLPSSILFASRPSAILCDPEVPVSPDFVAIDQYLTRQYVPSPRTAFAGISKLPAAHYLTCNSDGQLKIRRYWGIPDGTKISTSEEETRTELLKRIHDSVRQRMVSDVPIGAFLSGGVDSGTIVALMALESSQPVKTFSIGFEEAGFNELPEARLVARRFGTDHHECVLNASVCEIIPDLVQHYAEPFADSSAIPTFYVSRLARNHVTVALTGDGGDENFAGYAHYDETLKWSRTDFIPATARKLLCGAAASALRALPYTAYTARLSRALHLLTLELPERYSVQTAIFKPEEKLWCYTDDFRHVIASTPPSNGASYWHSSMDDLDRLMRHDQANYLPDCLAVKTDVASMAFSLELRAPFLDHELVEFVSAIPSSMKRNECGNKVILKNAVRAILPPEVIAKRKTGFSIPLAKWFRNSLLPLVRSVLLDEVCQRRQLFRQEFLNRMILEHHAGRRDWSSRLWALLMLELWFREYID